MIFTFARAAVLNHILTTASLNKGLIRILKAVCLLHRKYKERLMWFNGSHPDVFKDRIQALHQ